MCGIVIDFMFACVIRNVLYTCFVVVLACAKKFNTFSAHQLLFRLVCNEIMIDRYTGQN